MVGRLQRWLCAALAAVVLVVLLPAVASAAPGVPEGFEPPKVLEPADFDYPPELAKLDEPPAGTVIIKLVIDTKGRPKDLELVQGVHPDIDRLALDAVARLKFSPATVKGTPVEVEQQVPIEIVPPKKKAPEPEPEPTAEPEPQPEQAEPDTGEPEAPPPDLGPVRLNGIVKEAGQRTPISGASIIVVPARPGEQVGTHKKKDYHPVGTPAWELGTTTDKSGRFSLAGFPEGALKVHVVVLAPGYERLEAAAGIPIGTSASVEYGLYRLPDNPYRTVVESHENTTPEVIQRTITVSEINSIPGTQGDALKAIQNFPGVARAPFGLGVLAIRGTGPNDSAIFLGGHEIPTLFHFGGLTSVFNSDILERIDFVPGNFDSRYGDAIGGVIAVTPRKGRRDGFHGYVDSDLFDTGVLAEGPVGKGSWVLSGRRSYIDKLLPLVIPKDAGLNFSVAPRYYDYQGLFDYPVAGGNFTVRAFGSDDRTKLTINAPNKDPMAADDLRSKVETINYFHRFDLAYEKRQGPWHFLFTPSYRYEASDLGLFGLVKFNLHTHNISMRGEVERNFGRRHAFRVGTESVATWYDVAVDAPPVPSSTRGTGSTNERNVVDVKSFATTPAVYTTLTLGLSDRFRLLPGARVGYYTLGHDKAFVDPRLRFAWDVGDKTTLKGGTGLYSQQPQAVRLSKQFGNPDLSLTRGIQNSIGAARELPAGFNLNATTFFNYIYDQPASSTRLVRTPDGGVTPERFASTQIGRVYGLEVMLRRESTGRFYGWVAYTLMHSERRPKPGDDFHVFNFDQTHILTIIGVARLPHGWQAGARFRLVSGNPTTPIIGGVFDATGGSYIPINGPVNSQRVATFEKLDLRVDKKWTWKVVSLSLYFDLQNATNHQNQEFRLPSYDDRQFSIVPSLPIIPSFGTKLAW